MHYIDGLLDCVCVAFKLKMAVQNSTFTNISNASFAVFVKALTILRDDLQHDFYPTDSCGHYMPQSFYNPSYSDHPNIYILPIEAIEDTLAALADETGVVFNATGLTSTHYQINRPKTQVEFDVNDTWDKAKMTAVPYELYLTDPQMNIEICDIFCKDISLYAKACSSTWLQSSQTTQAVCRAERERIVSICGKEYDFFG